MCHVSIPHPDMAFSTIYICTYRLCGNLADCGLLLFIIIIVLLFLHKRVVDAKSWCIKIKTSLSLSSQSATLIHAALGWVLIFCLGTAVPHLRLIPAWHLIFATAFLASQLQPSPTLTTPETEDSHLMFLQSTAV